MNLKNLIIAVDFDGTVVRHAYPEIGADIGAVPVLRKIVDAGAKLILWTMRSGRELEAAKEWFQHAGIPLYGVQTNPTQTSWTSSPKAYAQLYIDDAALGAPLIRRKNQRPWINWKKVDKLLFPENQ